MATRDAVYAAINAERDKLDGISPLLNAAVPGCEATRLEMALADEYLRTARDEMRPAVPKEFATRQLLKAAAVIVRLLELHGVPQP